mmetsp:Transcript_49251/g.81892  ORF Transcript_49251/g.81892 Transcript_49251/m.81892 type:complete len:224 (-) Transcript_49251:293-964(-)
MSRDRCGVTVRLILALALLLVLVLVLVLIGAALPFALTLSNIRLARLATLRQWRDWSHLSHRRHDMCRHHVVAIRRRCSCSCSCSVLQGLLQLLEILDILHLWSYFVLIVVVVVFVRTVRVEKMRIQRMGLDLMVLLTFERQLMLQLNTSPLLRKIFLLNDNVLLQHCLVLRLNERRIDQRAALRLRLIKKNVLIRDYQFIVQLRLTLLQYLNLGQYSLQLFE